MHIIGQKIFRLFFSPIQIGQCCVDQVVGGNQADTDSSGKNEVISFENQDTYVLAWNAARIARFGAKGVFQVEIRDIDDGVLRPASVEYIPDDEDHPTQYVFDLGGPNSGKIVIT